METSFSWAQVLVRTASTSRQKKLAALHRCLNSSMEQLEYRYGDLQLAADDYLRKFGEHNLFNILAEKYEVD